MRNSVYSLECHLSLLLTCNVCRCIMSLIRGVMGKFPCPICLVPRAELHNLLETWPLRTRHDSVCLLRKARRKYTKAKREKKLKSQSLRDVEVSIIWIPYFWNQVHSVTQQNSLNLSKLLDVFRALCFDRLHTHHEGLWGKHLWIELQKCVNEVGRHAATKIDEGSVFFCFIVDIYYKHFSGLRQCQGGGISTTSRRSWELASLMGQSTKTY